MIRPLHRISAASAPFLFVIPSEIACRAVVERRWEESLIVKMINVTSQMLSPTLVKDALENAAPIAPILVQGWVWTRRHSPSITASRSPVFRGVYIFELYLSQFSGAPAEI
jgi:hypothetical protein